MEMIKEIKEYLNITMNIITQITVVTAAAPTPVYIVV